MKNIFSKSMSVVMSLVLILSAGLPATVLAIAPSYSVAITSTTFGALSLTLSGTASAVHYTGTEVQQHVSVDWGDGVIDDAVSPFSPVFSGNDFSGTWGPVTHNYSVAGPVTVVVAVCHQSCSGAEGADNTFSVDVIIPPATLTVIKHVSGGSAIASDFTLSATGTNISQTSFAGSETGTILTLDPGAFSISETPVANYVMSTSTDCAGTIASGQNKTCTVTNTFNSNPPPVDVCPNDPGIQTDLGQCTTPPPADVCPNVTGDQASGPCADEVCEATEGNTWNSETQTCEEPSNPQTPSIVLTKSAQVLGDKITYTINWQVLGSSLTDLVITDQVPDFADLMTNTITPADDQPNLADVTFPELTFPTGSAANYHLVGPNPARIINWDLGPKASSTSGSVTFKVELFASVCDIDNTAHATGTYGQNQTINASSSINHIVTNNNCEQPVDVCTNLDGVQATVPQGYHSTGNNTCAVDEVVPPTCDSDEHLDNNVCVPNESSQTASTDSGSGGGGGGGGLGGHRHGGAGEEVLGASTGPVCEEYLHEYIKLGKKNNPEEVKKLQAFLNEFMSANLPVTGFYGPVTYDWVKKFQEKHNDAVLLPWAQAGNPTDGPTGYVYKTTKRWINILKCPELLPITPIPAPLI